MFLLRPPFSSYPLPVNPFCSICSLITESLGALELGKFYSYTYVQTSIYMPNYIPVYTCTYAHSFIFPYFNCA